MTAPGTPGSSPQNAPAWAAAIGTALGTLLAALGRWGLDSVEWPDDVEAACLGVILLVAGAIGWALGKVAQRYTWRDDKVQALIAEVADHGDKPLDQA